jgi:hypothetical protein
VAYLTNTILKVYLGITESTDDTLLTTLITAAQAAIDAFCRQTFEAAADTTRYFDPTLDAAGRWLYLDAPLAAITSVTNGDGNTVTSGNYITEPRNVTPYRALVLKGNSTVAWTWTTTPENSIAIVGKWAYSTSAPADVAQACTRLAAYLYRQKNNSGDLDRAMVIGANAMLLPSELPKDVYTLLRPYRRLI